MDAEFDLGARVADGVVEQVDEHAQDRGVVAVQGQRRGRGDDADPRIDGVGRLVCECDGVEEVVRELGARVFTGGDRETA